MSKKWSAPKLVFEEYKKAQALKAGLDTRGLFEQSKINERFFVGDQWRGCQAGDEKPLIRYNVIKRIGDYKMSMIGSSAVSVHYSAEGIPSTREVRRRVRDQMNAMRRASALGAQALEAEDDTERINIIMSAMSDYFKVTAERVKFEDLKTRALRKAYLSGTGILYAYWDERVKTGLYADSEKKAPIVGDIQCEVLDIENVCFGDPMLNSVQDQPYIIIAQRKSVEELKRKARRNRRPQHEIDAIKPDREYSGYIAGDRAENEPYDSKKTTVLTKFYKEWDEEGQSFKIYAVEVVDGAVIRAPWDIRLRMYPIAKMVWEERANSAYGDSEVTHLIPNQIAINRAVTASAWSVMMNGMPIMVVNRDVVAGAITNEPGQVVPVYGDASDVERAIKYITPPNANASFESLVSSLVANTLTHSGANDAALGNMRPDNTSAIMAVRDAAAMPMQLMKTRFYSFVEDVARIFAEFWVNMYGNRALKIIDKEGEWYIPFNGDDCKDLMICARVDVGEAGLWSEIQTMQTLDNLYNAKVVDVLQYLERLPRGIVPDLNGLIEDIKERQETEQATPTEGASAGKPPIVSEESGAEETAPDLTEIAQMLPEEYREAFMQMSPEEQQQVAARMMGGV